MKRFLSALLVLSMVICLVPAFAVNAADVIEISSAEDFAKIADDLSGNYKLTADIKITQAISHGNEDEGARFKGTLDGDGHTITLDIYDGNGQRFGIFCSAEGCTIKNLNVKGTIISSGNSTGVLIGTVKDTGNDNTVTIDNVTTDVDIFANNSSNGQGGFIGCVEDNTVVNITNSTNNGDIGGEAPGGFIGALKGDATANFTNCTNNGNVYSVNRYSDYRGAGGFIGKAQSNSSHISLTGCTNNGTITSWYLSANAFVAHNNLFAWHYTVKDCVNNGKVISGGYELPSSLDFVQDAGTWSWGGFNYDEATGIMTGSPNFHALPNTETYKAYLNGIEATDKVSVSVVEGGNRQLTITADFNGIDASCGFRSMTLVWGDGKYSTFGLPTIPGDSFHATGGCGFIDSNLRFDKSWVAGQLDDIKVIVNGNQAYWNNGSQGYKHCGLYGNGNTANGHLHLGIVGADLVRGVNTMILTDGQKIYTHYFNSDKNALGVSYSKVVYDEAAGTVVAKVAFNNDPGFAIGTTFEGRVHDEHFNLNTYKVTAYDADTGIYTIETEGFTTGYTIIELRVTSECDYKDYWVTLTVNEERNDMGAEPTLDAVMGINGLTQVKLISATATANGSNFGNASNLINGQDNNFTTGGKLEGGWPGTVTITVEAETSVAPSYIVFYTDDDGQWQNRAPKFVRFYGSNDNSNWTFIRSVTDTGIQNVNNSGFPVELDADTEYKYFRLEVLSYKGGGYFQIKELVLYTGGTLDRSYTNQAAGRSENVAGENQTLSVGSADGYDMYYQTRISAKAGCTDYRFVVVATEDTVNNADFGKIVAKFAKGEETKSIEIDITKAYPAIEAKDSVGLKTTYTADNGTVILGIVITGVPSGYVLDTDSVDFVTK